MILYMNNDKHNPQGQRFFFSSQFICDHHNCFHMTRQRYHEETPVSLTNFCSQSKFDGNLLCYNSVAGHKIAMNFCTRHDSTAVLPFTEFYSHYCIRIEVKVKRNVHRIWIAMEKPSVKRGPGMKLQWSESWWRHQTETFSALLAFVRSPVNFPHKG